MTQNNLKIAITGGIGSGKSTVAQIIRNFGYDVISCDDIYRQLLSDESFVKRLAAEFGDVLTAEGELDRKKLSSIVFSDKEKLNKLNTLTHPIIMNRAFKEMENKNICFCEVPLLFEGGYDKYFDGIIVVMRNNTARLNSVAKRDGLSINDVQKRINNQFNYNNLDFEKYYVIHNDFNFDFLNASVADILERIKNLK